MSNSKFLMGWAILALLLLTVAQPASAATYAYDNLNRLTSVTYADGSTIEYSYDAAGNILKVTPPDSDPPTTTLEVAPSAPNGENGWYTLAPLITLTADEPATIYYRLDGGDDIAYSTSFAVPEGTHTLSVYAVDLAENTETAQSFAFSVDTTAPEITIAAPQSNARYLLNALIFADFSATDALSGLASLVSEIPNGAALDTTVAGEKTFSVVAADNAGNTKEETVIYHILYEFSGVLPPLKQDGSGSFKEGSTIPVKFALDDANGKSISSATARLYLSKVEDGQIGPETQAPSTSAAEGNRFRYDAADNQYIFNLKTKELSTGVWQLRIELDDGTSKYVNLTLR